MMRILLLMAALIFLVAPNAVGAEPPSGFIRPVANCWPEGAVKKAMADKHQESSILQIVTREGHLIELLSNKDGSSWTLILNRKDEGVTCVLSSGEGIFHIPYKAPDQGS